MCVHTVSTNVYHARPIVLAMPFANVFWGLCLVVVSGTTAIVFFGLLCLVAIAIVFLGLCLVVVSGTK